MILTKDVPPGTPPGGGGDGPTERRLPDLPQGVGRGGKANNPKVTALRIKRPPQPPEFAVDARGFLVALLHDFQIDVPAPDPQEPGRLRDRRPGQDPAAEDPAARDRAFLPGRHRPPRARTGSRARSRNSPVANVPGAGHQRRRVEGQAAEPGSAAPWCCSALATKLRSQPINVEPGQPQLRRASRSSRSRRSTRRAGCGSTWSGRCAATGPPRSMPRPHRRAAAADAARSVADADDRSTPRPVRRRRVAPVSLRATQ